MTKNLNALVLAFVLTFGLSACSPEVGSEEWYADLKEKTRGDWSVSEVGDYAKHCLLN